MNGAEVQFGFGTVLLLVLAGVGAGVTGSTAGLASLISYPALLAIGLPPVTANVTNTVGLIGSSIGSVSGSRRELRGQGRDIRRWIGIAMAGGAAGAALLLLGPAGTFEGLVPYLIAGASILLLASPRLRAIRTVRANRSIPPPTDPGSTGNPASTTDPDSTAPRPGDRAEPRTTTDPGLGSSPTASAIREPRGPLVPISLFFTCVYGGYFGAAAGVMILALLLFATDKDFPAANAIKNLLLGVANATASIGFIVFADVRWAAAVPLGLGCIVGGAIGPAIVRRVPPTLMRTVVAVAGFGLAIKLWVG